MQYKKPKGERTVTQADFWRAKRTFERELKRDMEILRKSQEREEAIPPVNPKVTIP